MVVSSDEKNEVENWALQIHSHRSILIYCSSVLIVKFVHAFAKIKYPTMDYYHS